MTPMHFVVFFHVFKTKQLYVVLGSSPDITELTLEYFFGKVPLTGTPSAGAEQSANVPFVHFTSNNDFCRFGPVLNSIVMV